MMMKFSRKRAARPRNAAHLLSGALLSTALFAGIAPLHAQNSVSARLDATAGVTASRNPFLLPDDNTDAVSVDGELRPSITLSGERSQIEGQAYYRRREYFRRYDGDDSFGGAINGNTRLTEKSGLRIALAYDNSIVDPASLFGLETVTIGGSGVGVPSGAGSVGGSVAGNPGTGPGAGGNPALPLPSSPNLIGGDVALVGTTQRRSIFSTSALYDTQISERTSLTVGVSAARAAYPDGLGEDANYKRFGGQAGLTRALSERLSLGVQGSAEQVDYDTGFTTRIYSPQLTLSARVAESWTIGGSAGVSFIDRETLTGNSASTNFAASLNACRTGERSSACIAASRAAAAAFDGVRPTTAVSATYSYQLDQKSAISAAAGYSRSDGGGLPGDPIANDLFSGSVNYRRELLPRVQLFGAGGFQTISSPGVSRPADISGRIGVIVTLGDLR